MVYISATLLAMGVNHLDVLGDVLGLVNDLLHVHGRVVNNPLSANRQNREEARDGDDD